MIKQKGVKRVRVLLVVSWLLISAVGSVPGVRAEVGTDELIVEVKRVSDAPVVAARYGLEIVSYINDQGHYMYLMRNLSGRAIEAVISDVNRDRDVKKAEWNQISTVSEINSLGQRSIMWIDGGCGSGSVADQAELSRIRAPEAQQFSTGAGALVAVIDTGIDFGARLNIVPGYDFIGRDNDASDVAGGLASGHGTMVSSLILAVAPNAQILPIRAFDQYGFTATFQLAEAIDYARGHGASVINMSFSFDADIELVRNAIRRARNAGITLVAAAGNDGSGFSRFPAEEPGVLSVAAVDSHDVKASFSNYGHTEVSAPGVSIEANGLFGSCALVDGTSFSAALVSGEAALLVAVGRANPSDDITRYGVRINTLPGNRGYRLGPRIDCYAALTRR